jgi:predicted amidophosphoribosyltransferase
MQPIEIALFGAMIALAAGLIGYLLWPLARARRGASRGTRRVARVAGGQDVGGAEAQPLPMLVCPACQREYDAGLQFCPHDARELVPASDPAARAAVPGMTCPSCRRSFDGMKRFCPFDGDELVPLTVAVGGAPGVPAAALSVGLLGKICPHCSRRYESDATFCGRDGAALVSVN